MSNKAQFTQKGRDVASIMSNLADDILAWRNVYWDRGYNDGGADELEAQDIPAAGVTVADVTGMVTFADALETFLTANRGYLSKMRNDL